MAQVIHHGDDFHKGAGTGSQSSADALFSMYNQRAEKYDEKMTESWKGDAEGILVFTGLFSATVAQLLASSLQNLQPNPQAQDASAFYLARIYQLTPGSNASSIPLPFDPSTFAPPTSALWVNALWSLSLVISLVCALLATLLQQWARRYLRITQTAHNPRRRARIRELMVKGVEKLRLRWMVEALPALLHVSVFLFLSGFVIFLYNINHTIFVIMVACVGACTGVYLCIGLLPIIRYDSPYYTPFSTLVWVAMTGVLWLALRLFHYITSRWGVCRAAAPWALKLAVDFRQRMLRGLMKEVEDLSQTRSSHLDTPAISRMFGSLDGEDDDLEQFLAGIPGFYGSTQVKKDEQVLEHLNGEKLPTAIVSFMNRSSFFNSPPEPAEQGRIAICLKAITADPLLLQCTFRQTLQSMDSNIFRCVDFIRLALAQSHSKDADPWVKHYARCTVAVAISRIHDYNDDWIGIVQRHLGLPKSLLKKYCARGDSVRLSNLTHLIQELKTSHFNNSDQFKPGKVWRNVLVETRKLRTTNITPEVQHEFCNQWNDLVDVESGPTRFRSGSSNAKQILSHICAIHLTLHEGMPTAFSAPANDHAGVLRPYPRCNVPPHRV
ncbi:hypothetical protein BJV78DRAFT_1154009 [Lactifluus subvellereus]|nr:hypothetical protein BJV78DRAFT_1154009 [Lactifluus subvellereus]